MSNKISIMFKDIAGQFVSLCNRVIHPKKRVGVLNYSFENENYGAVLTAYALNKHLRELGYDVKNINYTANFYRVKNVQDASNFVEFKQKYLPMTKPLEFEDLKKTNKMFDVFVVGSDQVFRHSFVKDEQGVYYLSFVDKKRKKVSYAASFGISEFDGNEEDRKLVEPYFKSFDALSVREADGVNILKQNFGVSGLQVLDPVFLIDWNDLTTDFKHDDTVYYILHPELRHLAKNNMLNSPLTIEQWLSAIKNSNTVITDSFHGMCFCLLFKKDFVALAHRNSPLSRLYSLFDMLSIPREKIVFNDMNIEEKDFAKYIIKPDDIAGKLTEWRKISNEYIEKAIGDVYVH